MPTKRTRVSHQPINNISSYALYRVSDGLWGDEDAPASFAEKWQWRDKEEWRDVYLAVRDELLSQWISEFPRNAAVLLVSI